MIEMKVAGIVLNAASRSPMILLKDSSERRALPIFIGQDQAEAIIKALEGHRPSRPLTHDLIANIFDDCNIKLERIIIHALTNLCNYYNQNQSGVNTVRRIKFFLFHKAFSVSIMYCTFFSKLLFGSMSNVSLQFFPCA